MIDPRKPPQTHRTCPGPCGRILALSEDNYTLRKGPGRYPWQPSAYLSRCRACQPAYLKALRDSKRAQDNESRTERRRSMRKAVACAQGMTEADIRDHRTAEKAKEAERLRKALLRAKVKRDLYRPYVPQDDPIKRHIKDSTSNAWRRRLGR